MKTHFGAIAVVAAAGFTYFATRPIAQAAPASAVQRWEMAEFVTYNQGSMYGLEFAPAGIKFEVERTGDSTTDPWPKAYDDACRKIGGSGSFENRVSLSGWEPFSVQVPTYTAGAHRTVYYFRRPVP